MAVTFLHSRADSDDTLMPGRVELIMEGRPVGKARLRLDTRGHGRLYTPTPTLKAERALQAVWMAAGSPRLEGAIHLGISLVVARPKGHYLKDGGLSASGRRKPYPTGVKPDLDNACKLAMDALNGRLYRDDVDVVELTVLRYFSDDGWERTIIRAWSL